MAAAILRWSTVALRLDIAQIKDQLEKLAGDLCRSRDDFDSKLEPISICKVLGSDWIGVPV